MEMLTTEDAAKILGLDPRTLANWRRTDPERLPFYKYGESRGAPVRYAKDDVLAYMDGSKIGRKKAS